DLASFQSSGWNISSRVLGTSPGRPYFTNFIPTNVNIANGSLLLTCSAYNAITSSVPSAQIKTSRADILYGSFRAQFEVRSASTGSGAVSAFFFYADDYSEVDIEVLT
ncbi:glycoside hydrolase family 16 protein, partial [Cadophora sp. DSE1049]